MAKRCCDMNIMLYGSSYPPIPYGASRYFGNLAEALVKQGHHITVVTAQQDALPECSEPLPGLRIYRIASAHSFACGRTVAPALDLARRHRVQIIQGVEYRGECAPLIAAGPRPPVCIKIISSISMPVLRRSLMHGPLHGALVWMACLRAWRQWRQEWVSMHQADLVFGATEKVLIEARRTGRLPACNGVVPNPVSIPTAWRNAEATDPTLLMVGRLDFGKGIAFLPGLLRRLQRDHPKARLMVAGGDCHIRGIGSTRKWLSRRLGPAVQQVDFMGELNQAELDQCYRKAWVVIVPSRWDSCSNVTLEAMARAKPVVVSPFGGMSELVQGTGAVVADPKSPRFVNAVGELLRDHSLRTSLGNHLHIRARNVYSPEKAAASYIRFISNYLAGST